MKRCLVRAGVAGAVLALAQAALQLHPLVVVALAVVIAVWLTWHLVCELNRLIDAS